VLLALLSGKEEQINIHENNFRNIFCSVDLGKIKLHQTIKMRYNWCE
jgi:hypothetical protein